jgi:hypothetical protein
MSEGVSWYCTTEKDANGVVVVYRLDGGRRVARWDRETKEWQPLVDPAE